VGARLFGPIEVAAGGRRLGPRDLGGPKAKQVLELLLVARGHNVTKDRLADQLWGEALPKRAFAALENHVSVLRRHLDGVGRGRDLVITDPGGYRVAAERIDLDLDRFDERITAAGKAGTRMARKLLSEAVQARARGEVLEDEPYAKWADELRRTYRARLLEVHLDAAESALAERDTRSAIDHAQAAMAIDPYAEQAHRLAMLAHYTQGDQRESLAGYQRLRSLLSKDLGIEPTPQTQQVQAAILAQEDPASMLPRPLERQGRPPQRPSDAPLIGRRTELSRLEALVGEACASTLAIAVVEGEDGVGKTRLLDELAARLPAVGMGRGDCSELERLCPTFPWPRLCARRSAPRPSPTPACPPSLQCSPSSAPARPASLRRSRRRSSRSSGCGGPVPPSSCFSMTSTGPIRLPWRPWPTCTGVPPSSPVR
jgi:DNA-binding SARP family transcriptional activator